MEKPKSTAVRTEAVENYLKAIYQLGENGAPATVQAIAGIMRISSPAVSKMLRHLAGHRLVECRPHKPTILTPLGEKIALEVVRHHRLIELYLTEALGYGWEKVHAEAERLEHHISEEFEDAIDRLLGFPLTDPHGSPIPRRNGEMPIMAGTSLESQAVGAIVIVRRIADENEELLLYMAERAVRPNVVVQVLEREPFAGSLLVKVVDKEVRISPEAARNVFVEAA